MGNSYFLNSKTRVSTFKSYLSYIYSLVFLYSINTLYAILVHYTSREINYLRANFKLFCMKNQLRRIACTLLVTISELYLPYIGPVVGDEGLVTDPPL